MGKAQNSDDDRRRLSALALQYEQHREFRDVYVEGSWDKSLVEWFVRTNGLSDVVVYDIDTVYIPSDILQKHGFHRGQDGKKERVIALAKELEGHATVGQVTCIADRDYDLLLEKTHQSVLLLTTDFSCQEMYLMNEAVFGKFLGLVVGCPVPPKDFLANLFGVLRELHLMRATNLSLMWGLRWLPPEKCCSMVGEALQFRGDEFVEKYLNKGAKLGQKGVFVEELSRLRKKMGSDGRNYASKDDLFSLLTEVLPKFCKGAAMHQPDVVARLLIGCVEEQHLVSQPMYASLLDRLRSPANA